MLIAVDTALTHQSSGRIWVSLIQLGEWLDDRYLTQGEGKEFFGDILPSEWLAFHAGLPFKGFVHFAEFYRKVFCKRKGGHGWQVEVMRAFADTSHPITKHMLDTWAVTEKVPELYYNALDHVTFVKRCRDKPQIVWSANEDQWLANYHLCDPTSTNSALAIACSEKFGRHITENAIRGKLDRLRRTGHVPGFRKDMPKPLVIDAVADI